VSGAVLDVVLARGFLDAVKKTGLLFRQRLAEMKDRHPAVIAEVRGEGLLLGLRTIVPNGEVVNACRAEGLLTAAAGENVVRLLPPLIAREAEVSEAMQRLDAACTRIEESLEQVRRGAAE
jgi:acetylornithine/N-succinyldiaminopimelate aminotransferase